MTTKSHAYQSVKWEELGNANGYRQTANTPLQYMYSMQAGSLNIDSSTITPKIYIDVCSVLAMIDCSGFKLITEHQYCLCKKGMVICL